MTCYLRLHEVLIGVRTPSQTVDWDAVFRGWRRATTVADRDQLLSSMDLESIDVYDLPTADLSRFSGLIVSDRVDQEFLLQQRNTIHQFLEDGRVVVFSGGLFQPWLPGGNLFVPYDANSEEGGTPLAITPHPVFAGVRAEDFGPEFAYGYHPAPEGAAILVSLPGGKAAVYEDRASSRGTILVHAGHTLLGYATTKGPARQTVPQLIDWINREAQP